MSSLYIKTIFNVVYSSLYIRKYKYYKIIKRY